MKPWIFLMWLLALGAAWIADAAGTRPPPNIVLIFSDDLGYADIGPYGAKDIPTPNLDRMAREGTRWTSFYVAQPVCTASRAALMTGCYPNRVGLEGALNHTSMMGINPDEMLLPELLKSRGYATAIYGKWHLGHQPPFLPTRNGFDEFYGIPYSNDNGPLHPVIRGIPSLPLYENEKVAGVDPDQALFTQRFTDRTIAFIEKHQREPFFIYLAHVMPHVPIFARPEKRGRSARGLYGDVVAELDDSVGAILDTMARLKLDEKTLVIFTSDNGPFLSYGEHAGRADPLREGKLTTFEGGVRTPFIARWPGQIPAGKTQTGLLSALDLLPTFCALAGAKPPGDIDGDNRLDLLLGTPDAKGREVFYYYAGRELQAVRQGKWKLHLPHPYLVVNGEPGKNGKPANYANMKPLAIEESGIQGIASRHGYRVEKIGTALYDLEADPGETRNLADLHPEVVRELERLAETARADLGDTLTGKTGSGLRKPGDARPTAR